MIAPSVREIAGVVVGFATVPLTPFAVVTLTVDTVPVPPDGVEYDPDWFRNAVDGPAVLNVTPLIDMPANAVVVDPEATDVLPSVIGKPFDPLPPTIPHVPAPATTFWHV